MSIGVTTSNSSHRFIVKTGLLIVLGSLLLMRCDLFDITPPEIEIISPSVDASYFGTVPCEFNITDNRGVARVEVFLGDDPVHEFDKGPYKFDHDLGEIESSTATLKVVAYDKADNFAEETLELSFTLGFQVTAPNGGESWAERSTQTITWSRSGNVASTVSLEYSVDEGTNWNLITSSATNTGSYAWILPNLFDTRIACQVRVTAGDYEDVSDANFTISAEPNLLTVTVPNGAEIWAEQSSQAITWTSSGDVGDSVSIDYSLDDGSNWIEIASSTDNDNLYNWTLPNLLESSPSARVRINSTTTTFSDTSDAVFTINAEANFIALTSPNGGEIWDEQSTHNITWSSSGDVGGYVSLHYSLDGGNNWTQITVLTPNDGTESWTVPSVAETRSTCKVKVGSTSTSFADSSDANFTVTDEDYITLISPNGGEVWPEQSTQTITWERSVDVGEYVSLHYSRDGGNTWTQIEASTPNDSTEFWTLPNETETQTAYRVKVASTSTRYIDITDANFTISAEPNYLIVTSPNGGEIWEDQYTHNITWSYSGDVGENVSLLYSLNGDTNWTEITTSTPNNGSYPWALQDFPETYTNCKVRIASTSTEFADTSDDVFTVNNDYIRITSPNGGENFTLGSNLTIRWMASGEANTAYVDVYLMRIEGYWGIIGNNAYNTGYFVFAIPDYAFSSGSAWVKVGWWPYYDINDASFTIGYP